MINIVICDDEKLFLDKMNKMVKEFFKDKKISVNIHCFKNSSNVISNIRNETNLFFLDIMLPEISGLELASIIREIQPNAYIIFVSSMHDAVFTSIKYSPLRFIRKEFLDVELHEALNAFLTDYNAYENIIEINYKNNIFPLPVKSINFAESNKHYITLHTDDNAYTIRGKLSDYIDIFSNQNIIRINQSYMVNLKYIKKYDSVSVILQNDFEINIGRKYKEAFKTAFFKYKRKYYHADFL